MKTNDIAYTITKEGKIIVKMVKMGMDIDETRNHRIRGIIPCSNGDYIFIEVLQGRRFDKNYYKTMSKEEYLNQNPYEEYIWVDGCFRVDIPEDLFKNYSKEYAKYDRTSFKNMQHNKKNIVKLLQKFNENIIDIELVNDYYIDEFCSEMGFYRLYDDRLEHKTELKEIVNWYGNYIKLKLLYTCYNYDKSIKYEEYRTIKKDFNIEKLCEKYDKKTLLELLRKYEVNKKIKKENINEQGK